MPNAVDPSGYQLGIANCSASDQSSQIDYFTRQYVRIVETQRQWFLDAAHRRRMELLNILHTYHSRIVHAALTRHDCALTGLVSQELNLLLNSSNLEELFGLTCDAEFASRMVAVPGIVNAAGWQTDVAFGLSLWLHGVQGVVDNPTFIYDQSAGYLELRYREAEFLAVVRGQTFNIGGATINSTPVTDITTTSRTIGSFNVFEQTGSFNCTVDPELCFFSYVTPQADFAAPISSISLNNSALAEVAAANLLRRYLEYLEAWSQSTITTRDRIDDWSMADPIAYAAYCSRGGQTCAQMGVGTREQGWGDATEQSADKYDVLIRHFRYIFDPNGICTSSRCILRPSQVTRLLTYP